MKRGSPLCTAFERFLLAFSFDPSICRACVLLATWFCCVPCQRRVDIAWSRTIVLLCNNSNAMTPTNPPPAQFLHHQSFQFTKTRPSAGCELNNFNLPNYIFSSYNIHLQALLLISSLNLSIYPLIHLSSICSFSLVTPSSSSVSCGKHVHSTVANNSTTL